jgi:prepilin-type N-terminal cleavage/methylation domain-containing protein
MRFALCVMREHGQRRRALRLRMTHDARRMTAGFTLLEMMLAVVLLATGILGMMDLLHRAQASTMDGDNVLAAGFLAQRCQEQLRRLSYSSLSTPATLNAACTVPDSHSSQFTRTITSTAQTSTPPYNTADLTRLDIELSWATTGGTSNVTLSTLRANN